MRAFRELHKRGGVEALSGFSGIFGRGSIAVSKRARCSKGLEVSRFGG